MALKEWSIRVFYSDIPRLIQETKSDGSIAWSLQSEAIIVSTDASPAVIEEAKKQSYLMYLARLLRDLARA